MIPTTLPSTTAHPQLSPHSSSDLLWSHPDAPFPASCIPRSSCGAMWAVGAHQQEKWWQMFIGNDVTSQAWVPSFSTTSEGWSKWSLGFFLSHTPFPSWLLSTLSNFLYVSEYRGEEGSQCHFRKKRDALKCSFAVPKTAVGTCHCSWLRRLHEALPYCVYLQGMSTQDAWSTVD